jgi:hypothetical protein
LPVEARAQRLVRQEGTHASQARPQQRRRPKGPPPEARTATPPIRPDCTGEAPSSSWCRTGSKC